MTIGLAYWNSVSENFEVIQSNSVDDVIRTIRYWDDKRMVDRFIVEDYLSGGNLTTEAKTTIMLVGFFSHWMGLEMGPTDTVVPQRRLSAVGQATKLIGDDAKDMHRNGRDAIAALAHAIAYARTAS